MTRVLFVCLGNICRSPMGESILTHKIKERGLENEIEVDSAGTGNWHVGEWPDHRTRAVLAANGIEAASRARQFRARDFQEFDHIVAMDDANMRDLRRWEGADPKKITLAMDWTPHKGRAVPDPYYGDMADFECVYAMLDEATDAILEQLAKAKK